MYQTHELYPGITLRCIRAHRFKQGALSIRLLRPMCSREAACNALLPAVLLRGCRQYPDMRHITNRLDDLYGASLGASVRRIGDYQTTGLACGFVEDRFALPGDRVVEPMIEFLGQLLFAPLQEDGGFVQEIVESEKRNLISLIDSERSDKRAYAAGKLLRLMGREDSYGIPRLGEVDQVRAIDHKSLFAHYQRILSESPIEIFYVGSLEDQTMAALLRPLFGGLTRQYVPLPAQTPFRYGPGAEETEMMDIAQGKLAMGFVTPITNQDPRFAAMQLCNSIFGGGMRNKIFSRIREELSLCYEIGSDYFGSKGILTVNAGIDFQQKEAVVSQILGQLQACKDADISQEELQCAKESMLSSLRSVYDSAAAMENFFSTAVLSGLDRTIEEYSSQIQAASLEDVAEAAGTVCYHSSYFLRGDAHV